jgi:hypothetical protein
MNKIFLSFLTLTLAYTVYGKNDYCTTLIKYSIVRFENSNSL